MSRFVTTRGIALFGKRSAGRDFEWLHGQETIPAGLYGACEQLARSSNETGVLVSLVAGLPSQTFLVRTFRQGVDSAYRPIVALEVTVVEGGSSLEPADWLGLARRALQEDSLEQAGAEGPVALEIPSGEETVAPLDGDLLDRVRTGLPVSVEPGVARSILRHRPLRYLGLAFAPQLQGGAAVPWKAALASFVTVSFSPPVLSQEDQGMMSVLARRRPSNGEWEHLASGDTEQVQQALRWAVDPDGGAPSPVRSVNDALLPWLVHFRRQSLQGAALLRTLNDDLGGAPLAGELLEKVFPDLSAEARGALLAGDGRVAGKGCAALEELAAAGLLGPGSFLPLKAWVPVARESEVLVPHALAALSSGAGQEVAARLALRLPLGDQQPTAEDVARAARIAQRLELPPPVDAVRDALSRVHSPATLTAAVAIGRACGGEGALLAGLARDGILPAARLSLPADLALALVARLRTGQPVEAARLLVELWQRGWEEEIRALLAAAEPRLFSPVVHALVVARLDGGPVLEAQPGEELATLARGGLVLPENLVPAAKPESVATIAGLWPSTAPLAAVLRGGKDVPDKDSLPAGWLPALRRVLTPPRVERWLRGLSASDRPAARAWAWEALGIPGSIEDLFSDLRPTAEAAQELKRSLDWIGAFARPESLDRRLEILTRLAQARAMEGEAGAAERAAHDLLPDSEPELREVAAHLLSGIGPFPHLRTTSPEVLARLTPSLPAIVLVNALFVSPNPALTDLDALVEAVFWRVTESGVACPERRYLPSQLKRHEALAHRLAGIPGWSALALDDADSQRASERRSDEPPPAASADTADPSPGETLDE